MKFCLIENLNNNYKLPKNYTYVALTQEAIYYLDKRNLKYITMEDFYSSGEIRGNTDQFLRDQLEWIDIFDDEIKSFYPDAKKLDLKLASIYFYWIKYMVDNIILSYRVLQKFILSTSPKKILFINDNYGEDNLSHWEHILHFQGVESTYSRILPLLCAEKKIEFDRIKISKTSNKQKNFDIKLKSKSIFPYLINKYQHFNNYLKSLNFLLTQNFFLINKSKYRSLYLSSKNFIKEFSIDFDRHYVKKYLLNNNNIYSFNLPIVKKTKINIDDSIDLKKETFNFNEINRWIDEQCAIDISSVIKTRLDTFVYSICPKIINLTKIFLSYYKKEKIDFIIASHIFSIEEHAALLAANISKDTKSIYFHHGADAYEFNCRYFILVRNFDYYFTSTLNEAKHEEMIRNKHSQKTPIIANYKYFSEMYSK